MDGETTVKRYAAFIPDKRDNVPGFVYLLHFDGKIAEHAQHYLGWTHDLEQRIARHRSGDGAKITSAVVGRGIPMRLVAYWHGTRNNERMLKRRHNHRKLCPVCTGQPFDGTKVPWTPRRGARIISTSRT